MNPYALSDAMSHAKHQIYNVEKQADRALYALVVHLRVDHGMKIKDIARRTTLSYGQVQIILRDWPR